MNEQKEKRRLEVHTSTNKRRMAWSSVAAATAVVAFSAFGVLPDQAEAQQAPRVHSGQSPDYHEVRSGDTMWDLSGTYFGDHYEWPRMWGYNPHITNPHWIYPGDIIHLQEVAAPEPEAQAAAHEETEQRHQPTRRLDDANGVGLYVATGGVMTTEEETPVGRIIGSPIAARMLAEHQDVWVGFGEQAYREDEREELDEDDMMEVSDIDADVGDRFAIIREAGKLTDDEGEVTGIKYYVLGSLTITEVPKQEEVAKTAEIDKSWREIERGDLLVPYERQLQLVQPREAESDLVARIVDSLDPSAIFGPQQYLFVNRGAEDGVRPGNRFFVYQQWEGFEHPHEQSAPEIPWQQVGQVMVINVRENYSMVVVTRSDREVLIGDRLEMYRGH